MTFHMVMPRPFAAVAEGSAAPLPQAPRLSMKVLAEELRAIVHAPGGQQAGLWDKARAKCLPEARHWAFAASLKAGVAASDGVLCTGEIPGFQVAAELGTMKRNPALSVVVHNLIRPRAIAAMRVWHLAGKISNFIAVSAPQIEFLQTTFGVEARRTHLVWDHTDTSFFTPGASSPKKRPLIVSVGLEQRDYITLAHATAAMDVDVRISGFSKDAAKTSRTFPEQLPDNMTRGYYSWTDLVQLYRDADVVVVSTYPGTPAAGVQGVMEAMSCGRPVVVTRTQGLARYIDETAAIGIVPQDVGAMREAISALLANPEKAARMGTSGRRIACERHNLEGYVAALKKIVAEN